MPFMIFETIHLFVTPASLRSRYCYEQQKKKNRKVKASAINKLQTICREKDQYPLVLRLTDRGTSG